MSADQPFGHWSSAPSAAPAARTYHGEGYFDARNNVLNANSWRGKESGQGSSTGTARVTTIHRGSFGGPVPGTHKHLLFWGGFER